MEADPGGEPTLLGYPCDMTERATAHFLRDHPEPKDNVFLVMRLDPSPLRTRMQSMVRAAAQDAGCTAIRADDADYSGELWTNVKVCMDNSSLAVAIFDDEDRHAENLAVELGYLFARDTPCLILREQRLGPPVAMLAHRLHTRFDALDLEGTLIPALHDWLRAQRARTVA